MADNIPVTPGTGLQLRTTEISAGLHQMWHLEDATQRTALITALGLLGSQTTAAAILAKLTADPATQTTLAAVLAKITADPATQTTLAAVLAKLTADPATQTTLAAVLTAVQGALTVRKGQQTVTPVTILSGASLSAGIDLGVTRLVGVVIPATFEPTSLTFQASYDNTVWNNVYGSDGTEKAPTVAISRRVVLAPADFIGVRYVKVRGGSSGTPTVVAADRILQLISES